MNGPFRILAIVGLAIALVMIVATFFLSVNAHKKFKHRARCTGKIIHKERKVHSGESYFCVLISYCVNGVQYEHNSEYYSSSMKVGDDIELLYDKADPTKVSVKGGLIFAPIVTGILGVVFLVLFIVISIIKAHL